MNQLDLVPDECSDYDDTNIQFQSFISKLKVTHRWCPETRKMQSLDYFRAKLDKEISQLYTELGGES